MNLAAVGMENADIADRVGLPIFSVKRRLRSIAGKLDIRGQTHYRAILTHFALHEGLPNLFDRPNRKS